MVSKKQWSDEERGELFAALEKSMLPMLPMCDDVTDISFMVVAISETDDTIRASSVACHSSHDRAMVDVLDSTDDDNEEMISTINSLSLPATAIQHLVKVFNKSEMTGKSVAAAEIIKSASMLAEKLGEETAE